MEKYDKWKEEYYHKAKLNLKEELTSSSFESIQKLGIEIAEENYTENDFEELYRMILSFYDAEAEKPKDTLNISKEDYLNLLEDLRNINEKYNF